MTTYHLEHRTPKKGEQYICYNTQPPIVITVHDDWWQNKADVLVPVAPAWPDPPVIVIEEGMRAGETLTKEIVAIREAGTRDYLDEYGNVWIANADEITEWHEYVPDGYVPQENVYEAAAQGAAAAAPEPRREYTADELDNLPDGTCAWDSSDCVWQLSAPHWFLAGASGGFTNPLREGIRRHLYSAPKH